MSRRGGAPWTPTTLPQLRRQWCTVLGEGLERTREAGGAPAEVLTQAAQDLVDTGRAELYWDPRGGGAPAASGKRPGAQLGDP